MFYSGPIHTSLPVLSTLTFFKCILKFNIMQYCIDLSMTDTDFPYEA